MADQTKIEWADATLNYANGCSVLSPGCTNCYAMKLAGTRLKHHPSRAGLTVPSKAGPVWTGEVRLNEATLLHALGWKKPRRIFWNAHGDLFHEGVSDEAIDRLFAVCALTPQHTHMILTKRSARMRDYLASDYRPFLRIHHDATGDIGGEKWGWIGEHAPKGSAITQYNLFLQAPWPLPNVWLGVSVEDQARADERIPDLLATPAAVRFLSCEPLLGEVDLRYLQPGDPSTEINALAGTHGVLRPHRGECAKLDWVIAGGESGPGARPMNAYWARGLRDQCASAGVPFFFKQWGEFRPTSDVAHGMYMMHVGKKSAGRLLDGVEHSEFPRSSPSTCDGEVAARSADGGVS